MTQVETDLKNDLTLKMLEDEIKTAHTIDKKNWIRMYKALKIVKEKHLWKEWNESKSFSSWVAHFAEKNKIHQTILWNRFRAGEVYSNYCDFKIEKGEDITPIERIGISPDCLVFLEKINKHAPDLAVSITDKVIQGKIKRNELKLMYETVRSKVPNYSSCKKIKHTDEVEAIKRDTAKTAHVLATLSTMKWLGKKDNTGFKGSVEQQTENDVRTKDRMCAIPEFAVFTGTTTKSRRIDLLCIENINHENYEKYRVSLHGVEIKVSEHDLVRDIKFAEYAEFVDYIWLAVTPEIQKVALEIIDERLSYAGLLVVDLMGEVTKIKEPIKLNPALRSQALETAVLKLI